MADTALQPTTIEAVIEARLKELPFPKNADPVEAEGKTYQQVHDAHIANIERRAKDIPAVIDEATRGQAQKALTALVKVRRGIDSYRKDLFGPLNDLKKRVDGYLGTNMDAGLQARIRAIEVPIEEGMAKYDRELERIRQEEQRKLDDRNRGRAGMITAKGMVFNGSDYRLDDLVLFPVDLNTWNDEAWANWLVAKFEPAIRDRLRRIRMEELKATGITTEVNGLHSFDHTQGTTHIVEAELGSMMEEEWVQWITLARTEAQRRKDVAEEAQRNLFAEQQRKQKQLDDDRAELDRQMAQLRTEKINLRASVLKAMGAEEQCTNEGTVLTYGRKNASHNMLAKFDDQQWADLQEVFKEERAYVEEKQRQWKIYQVREAALRAIDIPYDGDSVWSLGEATATDHEMSTLSDDQWSVKYQAFHAAAEARNQAAEVTAAPDPVPGEVTDDHNAVLAEATEGTLEDWQAMVTDEDADPNKVRRIPYGPGPDVLDEKVPPASDYAVLRGLFTTAEGMKGVLLAAPDRLLSPLNRDMVQRMITAMELEVMHPLEDVLSTMP